MKRAILLVVAVVSLAVAAGCVHVASAQGGNTAQTNDAWFTEVTALGSYPGLVLSTRVYYCAPVSGGAATCQEAEMIEGGQAGSPGGGGGGGAAPPPEPAPAPEGGGEEGGGEEGAE